MHVKDKLDFIVKHGIPGLKQWEKELVSYSSFRICEGYKIEWKDQKNIGKIYNNIQEKLG